MGGLAIWSNGKIPGAQTELASAEMGAVRFANGPLRSEQGAHH